MMMIFDILQYHGWFALSQSPPRGKLFRYIGDIIIFLPKE